MLGKGKEKRGLEPVEEVVDLAARIGALGPQRPTAGAATAPRLRIDAPVPAPPRLRVGAASTVDERGRPLVIGLDEPAAPPPATTANVPAVQTPPAAEEPARAAPATRTPPLQGEVDVVVTPLATPDDWHRFEIALRRVSGIGQLRTEYYRHGVLKVRVSYDGGERLSSAMRRIAGYRVRVIGEDRSTLQILVVPESDRERSRDLT